MSTLQEVLEMLEASADPENLEGMKRYGIQSEKRLGVRVPDLRAIAKIVGKDHELAFSLWQTGIEDARILACLVDIASQVSEEQMEAWVADFNSWDVCDQVIMNLFDRTVYARKKLHEWVEREAEFEKRAGYVLIASLALHDKKAPDDEFRGYFPLIEAGSSDERNFVKKAVNWALRNIGKRSRNLNQAALEFATRLADMQDPTARWIGRDAIRDLTSDAVIRRLQRIEGRRSVQK
jgi:3-methyladenine DNA glycosylase AlkD